MFHRSPSVKEPQTFDFYLKKLNLKSDVGSFNKPIHMTLILDKSQSISYHPLDANILIFLTLVTFCKDVTTLYLESPCPCCLQ